MDAVCHNGRQRRKPRLNTGTPMWSWHYSQHVLTLPIGTAIWRGRRGSSFSEDDYGLAMPHNPPRFRVVLPSGALLTSWWHNSKPRSLKPGCLSDHRRMSPKDRDDIHPSLSPLIGAQVRSSLETITSDAWHLGSRAVDKSPCVDAMRVSLSVTACVTTDPFHPFLHQPGNHAEGSNGVSPPPTCYSMRHQTEE